MGLAIDDIRRALLDEGLSAELVDRALSRFEPGRSSPRDRRDQLMVAIASDFFSGATSQREAAKALSRDIAFPSRPRWQVAPECRDRYSARLEEIAQLCRENDLAMPSAETTRRILAGSRTHGKRPKTEKFRCAQIRDHGPA